MPVVTIRDPTLLERLRKYQPVPDDALDGAIYELLKRVESTSRPALKGLDNLPQLVVQEVMRALDGKLTETIRSALLPAVGNLDIEIPIQLSIKVRIRLEPVFDVTEAYTHVNTPLNNNESSTNGAGDKTVELAELERRAIEYLRERGGCWEGSAYGLARYIAGDVNWALEKRLRKRLVKHNGKLCLPEVAQA